MLTKHATPTLAEGEPDPATSERRGYLARRLLVGAIERYEHAWASCAEVHADFPRLPSPTTPEGMTEEVVAERREWQRLVEEADDDFDSAELALASRINNLFNRLAPEPHRVDQNLGSLFVPLAVRHGGAVYVLNYDPSDYEKETNIIAVFRESVVLDL